MALEQSVDVPKITRIVADPSILTSEEAMEEAQKPNREVRVIEIVGGRVILRRGPFTRYVTSTMHVSTGLIAREITSYDVLVTGDVAISREVKDEGIIYEREFSRGFQGSIEDGILRYVEVGPKPGPVRRIVDRALSILRC